LRRLAFWLRFVLGGGSLKVEQTSLMGTFRSIEAKVLLEIGHRLLTKTISIAQAIPVAEAAASRNALGAK